LNRHIFPPAVAMFISLRTSRRNVGPVDQLWLQGPEDVRSSFSRHLVRECRGRSLPIAMLASTIRGATAAVSVLDFAGSDAGQDQNRAVIAPPQAKHRQWPSFGR
jgi:hypothetical protein